MAKTIKFNLIMDNKPIRTVDDFRENFVIEDVLGLYDKGLLQKWLNVRGYDDFFTKVNEIKSDKNIEKIEKLIDIFEIECDENKMRECIETLNYEAERNLILKEYEKNNYKVKSIIDDYHSGYESLIDDIVENKNNMPKIKSIIKEIENNYMGIFNLNYLSLYNRLINNAPLAVFAILMNDKMRSYFITDENCIRYANDIYKAIKQYIDNREKLKEQLGSELKIFKGDTDSYWKDVEPKEKKVMIISIEYGNYIRNVGKSGEELGYNETNYNFVILNGIDYKSNSSWAELLYMEV